MTNRQPPLAITSTMIAMVAATMVAFLLVATPSTDARTGPPTLAMGWAKHDAWDRTQAYKETWEVNWTGGVDEVKYRCKRVSRTTIDCTSSMLFWNSNSGCVNRQDAPGDERCPPGTRHEEWWEGERHSWTMRYRAVASRDAKGRWQGGNIVYYHLRDRYAQTDPTHRRFGGRALRKVEESGE